MLWKHLFVSLMLWFPKENQYCYSSISLTSMVLPAPKVSTDPLLSARSSDEVGAGYFKGMWLEGLPAGVQIRARQAGWIGARSTGGRLKSDLHKQEIRLSIVEVWCVRVFLKKSCSSTSLQKERLQHSSRALCFTCRRSPAQSWTPPVWGGRVRWRTYSCCCCCQSEWSAMNLAGLMVWFHIMQFQCLGGGGCMFFLKKWMSELFYCDSKFE